LKRKGFSDRRLAYLWKTTEHEVRKKRHALGIRPVFKRVDTCAAEFETGTAYMYSTYDEEDESRPTNAKKIMVLGGGPNRIGQGIEFDYCCVHAALALREDGFETIMVNCNPETVSTDYDTSDKLYFEPLTLEDTLALIRREEPDGVVVQFGGQTPLRLAVRVSPAHPVLIDQFLEDAVEVDVDAVSDGERVVIGGIMEHIERAGVHSGDSACSLPPYSLDAEVQAEIRRQTVALARELG